MAHSSAIVHAANVQNETCVDSDPVLLQQALRFCVPAVSSFSRSDCCGGALVTRRGCSDPLCRNCTDVGTAVSYQSGATRREAGRRRAPPPPPPCHTHTRRGALRLTRDGESHAPPAPSAMPRRRPGRASLEVRKSDSAAATRILPGLQFPLLPPPLPLPRGARSPPV